MGYIILITSSTERNVRIVGFDVIAAVTKMKRILWYLMLCSMVGNFDVFEEHAMGRRHIPEGVFLQC